MERALIIFYGEVAGIPLDWIVFGTIGVVGLMVTVAVVFMFRGGSKGPVEEDMALIATEDEHGTLQPGQLVGQCQRKEDTLLVTVPDWLDEEEDGPYTAELDIQKKVPFPFFDVSKALDDRFREMARLIFRPLFEHADRQELAL